MDLETLAKVAAEVIDNMPWGLHEADGIELAPGFFNVYNRVTGQSRAVLYHPESDYIFKSCYGETKCESRKEIGTVELDGKTYRMRFPEVYLFDTPLGAVEVQEYVHGEPDRCLLGEEDLVDAWCEDAYAVQNASGLSDTHTGNWLISGDDIIIFVP